MAVPLIVKTDYSLLKSMITIKKLVEYLKANNIKACAITDENLFGCIEFYNTCKDNDIKPIIGLEVIIDSKVIYLYAKDYLGYQNLLKINTLKQERNITLTDLELYKKSIIGIVPYNSKDIYEELNKIIDSYISYASDYEKNNALIITNKIVFANLSLALSKEDTNYLKYLNLIDGSEVKDYATNYINFKEVTEEDLSNLDDFANLCNVEIPTNKRYIPHYDKEIKDSYKYLIALAKKGIEKRLDGNVSKEYYDRLKYEIDVINKMGYIDYFLIVYDYVKYAKTHDILVGPGRGSAAGSLVSYALGITNIDPIKYDLLFERFLNPERVTMPDIDLDFEDTKRHLVIDYIKEKYGEDKVASIMTFSTLKSKQVLRDVAKVAELDDNLTSELLSYIDATISLKDNLKKSSLYDFANKNSKVKEVYKIAMKLENLKRQVSTHAAGVVICSESLDKVIPIYKNGDVTLTGVTMYYLENLGLIKMDILAIANLTIIKNVLKLIEENTKEQIDINKINLDDKETLELFTKADTVGIFQYESGGMKNFLAKLKPSSFSDLIAAVALFRPGPMQNIDSFIRRKEGKEIIDYIDPSLESILKDTYGIMVYQEQIMLILVKMASFTFAEADNIRRAMSKKKRDLIESAKEKFIVGSIKNGYKKELSENVYELILKFADYGFPKAHSVSYALIGYQMGYLKAKYPMYFLANLLNMTIASEIKTKEYLDEVKKYNVSVLKPSINESDVTYKIKGQAMLLPISIIKGVGEVAAKKIIEVRNDGPFVDYLDFVARCYGDGVSRKTIESLIDADVFSEFNVNHQTLYNNIENAITYADLVHDLDESLVMKPELEKTSEFSEGELMEKELNAFGFYVTNHPASKYSDKSVVKLKNMQNYFDKYVKVVVVIENIKSIKTKKNDDMAFISASDETGNADFVVFPKTVNLLNIIKKGDLVIIHGQVEKRIDKYQIIVTNIEKVKNN